MKSYRSFHGSLVSSRSGVFHSFLGTFLAVVLGPSVMAQPVFLDFDDDGPLTEAELPDWFDFYGFDPTVGGNWTITENFVNVLEPSNALYTSSEGEQLAEHFSRVAILKADVFEGQNVEISVEITWTDNDNVGIYARFNGESDDPLGNDYYYLRLDVDDGPPSAIYLYRVSGRVARLLAQATDDPFPFAQGETHVVTFEAVCNEFTVSLDGEEVSTMSPFVDPEPLLGSGRIGVGQNTNPTYYDNFELTVNEAADCVCAATRTLSSQRFAAGGSMSVTVAAANIQGATTITETFPATWMVTDAGGGNIDGNTITFDVNADGEVSYVLMAPAGFCEAAEFSGQMEGAGGCSTEVGGNSLATCTERPDGATILDFDTDGPLSTDELPDFFDFYGVDGAWTIEPNTLNMDDPSSALRTTSEGEQLEEFFSRVAIVKADVLEGRDVEFSVDITWDDNDNCGVYVRYNGESDRPLDNDYYFVRVDVDDGPPSSVYLYRVSDGVAELLAQATDDPFPIGERETHTVTVVAEDDAISVALDGVEISGMDPFVDPEPILACGRVGVGHNTNPSYYDNFVLRNNDTDGCVCLASRALSTAVFAPGDAVSATVSVRNLQGATTITETFPATWTVTDAGGGVVAGNTITFNLDTDGEVSYALMVPEDACGFVEFTGEVSGAGDCEVGVGGDSDMLCVDLEIPPGAEILDFDEEGPLSEGELLDWFDFYGFDPVVGTNWTIEPNSVNPKDPSSALRTTSEGEQLAEHFSRAAILGADVFEAENVFFAVDITWDDNDNSGVYVRFNEGFSPDDALGNDYYYARVDVDDGPPSGIYLYRVRDGVEELLVQATDDPFPISQGETHTVTLIAEGDELSVALNGVPVSVMDPFIDLDPLEGPGRVGVGHNTNPSYYDNFRFANLDAVQPGAPRFIRGDANADGTANITDGVFVLNHLFASGVDPTCTKSADADDSGRLDITDPVFLLNHLFAGGNAPSAPFPECGTDPSDDGLTCESFNACP